MKTYARLLFLFLKPERKISLVVYWFNHNSMHIQSKLDTIKNIYHDWGKHREGFPMRAGIHLAFF